MKRLLSAVGLILMLLLITIGKANAQNSNIGTEFWTGYMDHVNGVTGTNGSQMNLYIAGDVSTTVTVSSAGSDFAPITATVTPNTITTIAVPTAAFLGNTSGGLKGIHIVSQKPVAVYAHIYASSVSGATLLLPVNTLSNDYYSINFTQLSNAPATTPAYSTFMVIATEDSTTVQITPAADLLDTHAAKTAFNVVLQKGGIYQGVSSSDLTGSRITSVSTGTQGCKRIAVFSGSSKIKIGSPNSSSDNLFQQVYPAPTWGKSYITVPLKDRSYDVFRVVVSDPTTKVKVDGAAISGTLINNFYYEFTSQVPRYITADKPMQVVQYAVTQGNTLTGVNLGTDVGDPEMIYLNPLEQNIDHVTLYSAPEYRILKSYINVVIPTAGTSTFKLDGATPTTSFVTVPGNTNYSYAQFSVLNTTHTIAASQGFNAIAYGFGSAESYGYAAGTNVRNLNEFVQLVNPTTQKVASTGCTNATYNPQVAIPYNPLSITWDLGNGSATVVQNNPAYKSTIRQNDTTLYIYDYGTPVAFAAGNYAIKATVVDPISTLCGSTEEIDLNYTVVAPPGAKFSSRDTVCRLDTIGFKDLTDQSFNAIKAWHWDFGTGDTSNVQNPVYHFLTNGLHTVTLTVTGTTGCTTTTSKSIYTRILPIADFTMPDPLCDSPLSVTFIDKSVASEGKLTSWLWDFGDGTTLLRTSNTSFTHVFTKAQQYKVTLTVTTDKSCTASKPLTKTINFSPYPDFDLPDVCQADKFTHFTSTSTVTDSTTNNLTYAWDFGDKPPSVSATNPNTATGKSVQHSYASVGDYKVRLTVTTANGCIRDTVKVLTVNGSNPKADFALVKDTVCSNQLVTFVNKANVPGFNNGKVTSFSIDFGDGTAIQTYRLDSGKTFTHKYPIEYVKPVTKYTVTMTAFSGQSILCQNVYAAPVYILPVPHTIFAPPDSVCQNLDAFKLANYVTQPVGAPVGKPTFYIDGIRSPNGVFNPPVLGAGKHIVTCYYVVDATSCADTTIKTIKIEPIAAVKAGEDILVLSGATAQLKPRIIGGNNLTYLWTPSTGLSNPNILNPKAIPLVTTTYKLTVTSTTDRLSCPVSDSVKVIVLQALTVPNTFTPNGDSRNDNWYIKDLADYPGCIVEVYNRNGERVFYSIGYATPWDGRYNSVNLPVGTYYYIIDPKNGRSKISGSVTIIR